MIKNWGAAWAFLALLGLAALALRESSVPYNCHYDTANQSYPAADNHDGATNKVVAAFVVVGKFVDRHKEAVNVLASVVVAIFTAILAWKTWGLHVATRGLQDLAAVQSADMKESLRIAVIAAEAAKQSAGIAELSLSVLERAFVIAEINLTPLPGDADQIFILNSTWRNVGKTSTKYCVNYTEWDHCDIELPNDFLFDRAVEANKFAKLVIGPGLAVTSQIHVLRGADIDSAAHKRTHIYFWGWCEYDDIFTSTPRHRTEFCVEVQPIITPEVLGDGKQGVALSFSFYGEHNGADEECLKGIQTGSPKNPLRSEQKNA